MVDIFFIMYKMALIAGLVLEEVIKDVVIPWWVSSEVVAVASSVAGSAVVALEESKDPVPDISQ
jgi:hypothetical protein